MTSRPQIIGGIEKAPEALRLLFDGGNTGKLIVEVSSPSGPRDCQTPPQGGVGLH